MSTNLFKLQRVVCILAKLTAVGLKCALVICAYAAQDDPSQPSTVTKNVLIEQTDDVDLSSSANPKTSSKPVVIKSIERIEKSDRPPKEPVAWLGLFTEEASEALAAQLGLDAGSGLVVGDVSTNSPASQAGLQRNDVLAKLDGQLLVHPAQLRKLVHSRKPGDTVELTYYRAGKQHTATLTLAKAPPGLVSGNTYEVWRDLMVQKSDPYWKSFQESLPDKEALHRQLEKVKEAMGNIKIDQKKIQEEINRSLNGARKGLQEALSHMTNAEEALEPARRALEELTRTRINVRPETKVTVSTRADSVESIVKTDESGAYVILASPGKHLTVHSPDGKLVFDGDIETPEQQAQVPADLWKKVEPLLDQLHKSKASGDE